MPEISVIIPTRLRHHLLPRAVQSVLNQTFQDFEIIIIDDNSPEHRISRSQIDSNILFNSKIRIIENPAPKNPARARNIGLRSASGKWIAYLDDDDAYRPTKLEKQLKMAQQTQLPIGFCGVTYHLKFRNRHQHLHTAEFVGDDLLLGVHTYASMFHKNSCNIFFNEDLNAGEDAYMFLSLVKHFGVTRVFNVPESLMDIYPQPRARVNTNADGVWTAMQAIYKDFGNLFSPEAKEFFLLRSRLTYYKLTSGNWGAMVQTASEIIKHRGLKETRMIANAFLFKIPVLRWLFVG